MDFSKFQTGFYTLKEAERLTGAKAHAIRRWIQGYDYRVHDCDKHQDAIWSADVTRNSRVMNITFVDLVEILLIQSFRKHNVPWRELRAAANFAAKELNRPRPFSSFKFKTDGKHMLADIAQTNGLSMLLEITKQNYVMREVLAPYIKAEFAFDQGEVSRWYPPIAARKSIVLDPKRNFGRPTVARCGVPTEMLAASFAVEKSYEKVSRWFGVPPTSVRNAVEFERALSV